MKVLYIKNISIEGPEFIQKYFESRGAASEIIDLYIGERLPDHSKDYDAVVVLGGPMNVYEEEKYPFLKFENKFIKDVLKREIPYLGICLGSQLLAKAADSTVGRSPLEEIGFSEVYLNANGSRDPLFQGMSHIVPVFQWHGDMFEVPENGSLLAASEVCPNQAFRLGQHAYGLQFHFEIGFENVEEWAEMYVKDDEEREAKLLHMNLIYSKMKKDYHKAAEKICENFYNIVQRSLS